MGQSCSSEFNLKKKKKQSQEKKEFKKSKSTISQKNKEIYNGPDDVQRDIDTLPESIPKIENETNQNAFENHNAKPQNQLKGAEVQEQFNQPEEDLNGYQTNNDLFQQNAAEENKVNDDAKYSAEQEDQENSCPICLVSYDTLGETPTFTVCDHAFCSKCLTEALKIKPYCPLCRTYQPDQARESNLDHLFHDDFNAPAVSEDIWNLEVVRTHLREQPEGDGTKRVYLSNGEATNIFVRNNAKIQVSPNVNLVINGKRIENPQDCNVQ